MSSYRVELFSIDRGELRNSAGTTMEGWLSDMEHNGYQLVGPCQLGVNEQGVFVLATAERPDDYDD